MDPNAEIKRLLNATRVKMKPSDLWYELGRKAITSESPLKQGISSKELQSIYRKLLGKERLTYYEFAVVNNALEDSTHNKLGCGLETWFLVTEEASDLAIEWNKFAKTAQDKVTAELISKAQREGGKNGNVISMGEA